MKKLFIVLIFVLKLFGVNILIMHSYSPNLKWTTTQAFTINSILLKNVKNVNLYVEFMYTKRFKPSFDRCSKCLKAITEKYRGIKFDIIVTTDDNALNFIRKFKSTYQFKDAKVFFEGVNNLSLEKVLDKKIYAGVFEKKNPLSNLNIALKIKPNLKTIYVISDKSNSGNKTIKQYFNAFKKISNINFVYLHSSELNEILYKLENYDKNSIMMLLTFAGMKENGIYITPERFAQKLSKVYNNPMLVHNDVYTNIPKTNIAGGDCTDAVKQATLNTKKVIKYLNGTPMEKIGFEIENANSIYLNVLNLKKFGVDAYKLGIKDAVFVNQPTSFYEIYKIEIWSGIIFIVLIMVFMIILAKKNRDLHQYSQKIKSLNSSLEEKIKKAIEENRKKDQIMFQQSKLAAMGEMLGAIAHQWRQPLNALGLNIQTLLDDYDDGKMDEKYLEEFEEKQMKTINFMSKTIDDFKNFFKVDKEKTIFSLKEASKEVIKLFEKQIQDHNIKIICNSDDSTIEGYENEFKQVILNIINNAKEAIINNNVHNGEILIEIKDKVVKITDNGGGVPKEIRDKIFEPYFTSKENGTGIGLYMSKVIVENHLNGKLFFEVDGDKTTFIIDFKENEK